MLNAPPKNPAWLSWIYVVLWAVVIYLTIPFARKVVIFFREMFGGEFFLIVVFGALFLTAVWLLLFLRRYEITRKSSYLWLAAVAGSFGYFTWGLNASPEEALHFVQYGVLGVLLYRALCHHFRDLSVFVIACFIGAFLGALDEAIQWMTPSRVWDLRDVEINATAIGLVQIAIANGLRPPLIERKFRLGSLPSIFASALLFAGLVGGCLLNTPPVISGYIDALPGLSHLKSKTSQMAEYGYLFSDPEIGVFRSRFSPAELARVDAARGRAAGPLMDKAKSKNDVVAFIKTYTPLNDPYLHEARLHIWSRDSHLWRAQQSKGRDEKEYRYRRNAAFYENRIMEKYFPVAFASSSYQLPDSLRRELETALPENSTYESPVSKSLITGVTANQSAMIIGLVLLALFFAMMVSWFWSRKPRTNN